MPKYKGKAVFPGIAIGRIAVIYKRKQQIRKQQISDVEQELLRLKKASETTKLQYKKLYDKAVTKLGEKNAVIFEMHQMLLENVDYLDQIHKVIREEKANAEYAVNAAGKYFAKIFADMDDEYMRSRAEDILDVSGRLIQNLYGQEEDCYEDVEASIIVAQDLSPSQMVQLDQNKIMAIVLKGGSANSHAAILASTMNIPVIIGTPVEFVKLRTGMTALVDGFSGEVIIEPSPGEYQEASKKQEAETERNRLLQELIGKENETIDGHKIDIFANIGSDSDVRYVLDNDAGGIGLFRSEFIYMGRNDYPSEEEQFQVYKKVLEQMGERPVTIRTLDIGADKQVDYFKLGKEKNPMLGCRAIRICLKEPELFKTQLRALFRAAVHGNLSIMYPMITSTSEVEKIQALVEEAKQELERKNLPYRIPKQGIMIETPAAVLISDRLAQMVDFFSIGTNDLTQYTLAIDRENEGLDDFYDPHHEAILRMIQMVVQNAHDYGKKVSICGNMAADLELTQTFVRLGVDRLSLPPSFILKLREKVRSIYYFE